MLDRNPCPTGTRISDQQAKDIEERHLTRHGFHGEWNYTVLPVPRPAPDPDPEPPPARPGRCSSDLLNHPALTGLDPADLTALAAALEIPFRARREQRRYLRHGRARQLAEGASGGGSNRKLDLTGHLLATRMRQHLNLPPKVTGALLGAHGTTISHATSLTASLLAGQPQPPAAPPPGIRSLRTRAALRDTSHGPPSASAASTAAPRPPQTAQGSGPDHDDAPSSWYLPGHYDAPSSWLRMARWALSAKPSHHPGRIGLTQRSRVSLAPGNNRPDAPSSRLRARRCSTPVAGARAGGGRYQRGVLAKRGFQTAR